MTNGAPINGNGSGWKWNTTKEAGGLFVAEGVSMAVSLGTVAIADQIAPNLIKDASKAIAKTCVLPYLETIENGLKKICHLEECQPNYDQSREERAEQLAKTLIVFSSAWTLSMIAKVGTRMGLNYAMGIREEANPVIRTKWKWLNSKIPSWHDARVLIADEGVHIGSLLFVNTLGAKYTDDAIKASSSLLQKWTGCSKKKADEVSSMAIIWEVPNVLGWLAGVGEIAGENHRKQSKDIIKAALNKGQNNGQAPHP